MTRDIRPFFSCPIVIEYIDVIITNNAHIMMKPILLLECILSFINNIFLYITIST